MSSQIPHTVDPEIWNLVQEEKKRDKKVVLVSKIAWSVTGLSVVAFGMIQVSHFVRYLDLVAEGVGSMNQLFANLMPLVAVIGVIGLIVAILATAGIFLRLRTSSLQEIQVRLAALEQMFVEQSPA